MHSIQVGEKYLVRDQLPSGDAFFVFTWEDPRTDGYNGSVVEGVTLDYDMQEVHVWAPGQDRPEACLGRSPDDPKHYKVFRYSSDLHEAGYEAMPGNFALFKSWPNYARLRLSPPAPEQTPEQAWFEYLDHLDEAARRRRQRAGESSRPSGLDRDSVATWVARQHFKVDSAIREVWYLPVGAPVDEIRLLELSDRFPAGDFGVEPIDFGLDVEGMPFKLVVADVTTEQLDRVRQGIVPLPADWSLEGAKVWGRRDA